MADTADIETAVLIVQSVVITVMLVMWLVTLFAPSQVRTQPSHLHLDCSSVRHS